MTLKLGILTPFLWTSPSGVNRQVEALVERLTASGHRVTVIAPSADRRAVGEAQRRVQAVLTGERETVFLPDDPYPRYFFAGATYAVREARSSLKLIAAPADLIANIDVLLEAENLDLLHLHEPFVPGLGWTALQVRQLPAGRHLPRQSRAHRAVPGHEAQAAAPLRFPGRGHRVVGGDARRGCARVPRRLQGDPARRGPATGSPRGSRPPRPATLRAGPCACCSAGFESRRKGLGVLLRALRYLEDRAADLTLEVCGNERQERRYVRLVPPAFAGRVTFLGRVPEAQMPDVYRRADVLCAPSLGPETAAVSLLEAMAAGTAVVASRLPGYDEVVQDEVNGLLVPPRPRRLAAALRRLLDDPALPRDGSSRRPPGPSAATTGSASPRRSRTCTTRWPGGGSSRFRAAAASSASCSPTSTCTPTTARTA